MSLLDQIEGAHRRILNPSGGCHNCARKRIDYVPPTLVQGQVLWLGDTPGQTDVLEQEVFVGQSAQILRRHAKEAHVPGPWSFSNTVKCRPPNNGAPKPKDVACCSSQFTLDEVRGYPIVVLVGAVPLHALFPGAQASHFRGNLAYHPDFPGQRFYTIYDPSYLHRRPDLEDEFGRQMERLARIVRGEPDPPWLDHIHQGRDGLDFLEQRLLQRPLISLDFETDRVESWQAGATTISLAVTADGVDVVAMDKEDPCFVEAMRRIGVYLEQPEKSVVGGNVAFDVEWCEADLGIHAACGIFETSTIWYEAGQYKTPSLKRLVAEQLDGYRFLTYMPHAWEYPADIDRNYNIEDVVYPLELMRKGMTQMAPKTRDLVTRVLGPASLVFRQMQTHGFYLRQDYRKKKIEEYEEKRRLAVLAWKEEDPDFVPVEHESGKGLQRYLFDIKRLPSVGETAKGDPSTDAAALKMWIRDGATYLKHLLEIRGINKIQSTYLTAYDDHVGSDSRVHASFWTTSTDTSRPSSSDPNLYNIPRVSEIRDMFGVPPGMAMVESDLSQIEFRIMVCLAKDENGIAGYMRGEDAHTMTARSITGAEKPTKEQRSLAKPVNFGFLYGGSEYMVQQYAANEYGVYWSVEEARAFRETFMATYPRIPEFHEHSKKKLVANRGWFESATGHNFHYRDWNSDDQGKRDHVFRAAINSEGQGPAVNICFYIAVLARRILNERGLGKVRFVNSVYDSIMTEVPNPKDVPDVIATIEEARGVVYEWVRPWFIVPLIMDHKTGESWGSLQDWKP